MWMIAGLSSAHS